MNALRGVGAPLVKFLIFAAVTLLCSAVLAGTIANRVGGSTTDYSAKFTDATGVNKGDEIRIAGVRVGQVNDIRLVDRKVAVIDFSVRDDVALPKSTEATIKFRNLIGQRYVALEQGVGPPERLAEGAIIPLEQTHPAVNLTQLFNGFRPLLQALSPNDVNQLSFELVQVLQGEGGTVTSLLSRTASLTSTIADKDAVIGSVIDNLNATLDTLNARDTEFTQLVVTVRQLVSGLAQDRNSIGEAVSSIDDLTDATADLLKDARPPLEKDIKHLGKLAGNLNDNHELVDRFLTTLPKKLDVLIPLGTDTSRFNFFLCSVSGTIFLPSPPSPVPSAPIPPVPGVGTAPRCDAANLPNNFGIHNDHDDN
jgi:phospholipid/cholesterol/gamma-HCH transport system substrate-binding protein